MNVQLPQWLDDYIFYELGATYQPRYESMVNINDDKKRTLNYLGTYFPRSYAESLCIFGDYFDKHREEWKNKDEISIFDFGCGTGGEIIGLLTALNDRFPSLKKVKVMVLDGNHNALRYYERVLAKYNETASPSILKIENRLVPVSIDDFYDMSILDAIVKDKFDIVLTFKAICEFVTKEIFERKNAYSQFLKVFMLKLNENGILILEDVTVYSNVTDEWLPKMMDSALKALGSGCRLIAQNNGYNQAYYVTHSHKANDLSKVAWRMIK